MIRERLHRLFLARPRLISRVGAGLVLGLLLAGCGGGSRPTSSASKEITSINDALQRAQAYYNKEDYEMALGTLSEADSYMPEANTKANSRQKERLAGLSKQISDERARVMIKKKQKDDERARKRAEEEEAQKLAAEAEAQAKKKGSPKAAAPGVSVEEMEKKVAAEKAQQLALQQKEAKAVLGVQEKKEVRKDEDDEPAVAKAAENPEAAGEGQAPKVSKPRPAATGPFRQYGGNAPSVAVDKVEANGNFALAYIQLFNPKESGRRIGRVEVVFKDEGNGTLMSATMVFEHKKFDAKVKDLSNQPDAGAAIVGGSHAVDGNGSLQLVAVAEDARYAKKARKAAVTVLYEDGQESGQGPGSLLEDQEGGKEGKGGARMFGK